MDSPEESILVRLPDGSTRPLPPISFQYSFSLKVLLDGSYQDVLKAYGMLLVQREWLTEQIESLKTELADDREERHHLRTKLDDLLELVRKGVQTSEEGPEPTARGQEGEVPPNTTQV